jgi:hypothetical protein
MLSIIFLSLISNEVLIALHRCLDLIHTNCPTITRGVFNFLYKETVDPIIFINISFHNITKNIILHMKLKNPPDYAELKTSW